ncbi:hypothetical protein LguiA_001661 [Lonicera macranthoides]
MKIFSSFWVRRNEHVPDGFGVYISPNIGSTYVKVEKIAIIKRRLGIPPTYHFFLGRILQHILMLKPTLKRVTRRPVAIGWIDFEHQVQAIHIDKKQTGFSERVILLVRISNSNSKQGF